jgi:8-oxo-dGTP pyrophosphatase MutT (NUDIX family)
MKKVIPADAVLVPDTAACVFNGQIFDVYQWPQTLYDGSRATFEMLKRPDTVSVIGIVDGKLLVIDDEQPHVGNRSSFPGGRVDADDSGTLAAAQREVHEETGYLFDNWRLLRVWQPHGKLEWFIYLYLAWDGRRDGEPHLDAGERITVHLRNFAEVKELVITKSGYLGEALEIFEGLDCLEQLLALPEFTGQEVDR